MERAHGPEPEPCSPVSEYAEINHGVIPLDILLKRALGLEQEEMLPFICSLMCPRIEIVFQIACFFGRQDSSSSTSTTSSSSGLSHPWKKARLEVQETSDQTISICVGAVIDSSAIYG